MTNQRRILLTDRHDTALARTVEWNMAAINFDRIGQGEQAEFARAKSDRWQQLRKKLASKLYY
jgi:hypothetical protein